MDPKTYLSRLFHETIDDMSPENIVESNVRRNDRGIVIRDREIKIGDRPLYVLAVGKAAVPMTMGLMNIDDGGIEDMLVITPRGVDIPEEIRDKVIYGSHPVPDDQSLNAGKRAAELFEKVPPKGIALTLISGGTSSLMCLPYDEISIEDLNTTFGLLNNSGANIREINAVRKHCSQIKGGQLLRFLDSSVTLIDLVISDVPDDDLSVIGSGPTTTDSSDFRDAHRVLMKYNLWSRMPKTIRNHIGKGMEGVVADTIKTGEDPLKEHHAEVISSARKLAEKLARLAERDGYNSWLAEQAFNRDVKEVSTEITEKAKAVAEGRSDISAPAVLVFYGESTVNVTGQGIGGRNQELALHSAVNIANLDRITLLSAGTDGIDGPTDAAGAIVNGETIQRANDQGLDPDKYLRENDSYHFHRQAGTLLQTGPTGNNLMDVVLVFIE